MGPFPSSHQGQPPQFQQQGTGRPHGPGSHPGPAYPIWKRQTVIQPAVQPPPMPAIMPNTFPPTPVTPLSPLLVDPLNATPPPASTTPRTRSRIVAIILLCLLAGGLYFVWHSSPSSSSSTNTPSITQQNFSGASTSSSSASNTSSTGTIQVYIIGAVKHPGVYTLPQGARVHDLLTAAGGPLPQANLVALNLVAKLSDGQEVYVTVQGETPPNYVGGVPGTGNSSGSATNTGNAGNAACVNVNTASADDMRLNLHISSASAQAIINYRVQHGNYQSVQELANVVSKTVYDKIKGTACVS